MEKGSEPIMELVIDSQLVDDGSIEECYYRVIHYFKKEGVELEVTLCLVINGLS
jgi:hypothetical protein